MFTAITMVVLGAAAAATGPKTKPATATAAQSPAAVARVSPSVSTATSVAILNLNLVSSSVGWGFGAEGDHGAVLRTADGGLTWTDVSPRRDLRDPFTVLTDIDASHAWLGVPQVTAGHRTMTVYRTGNAGKSWALGEPIVVPDAYPRARPLTPSLQFADAMHGWLSFAFQANDPAATGVGLYATTDGGNHWRLVSLTLDHGGQSTVMGLPIGCDKTGIVFITPADGWATGHCDDGSLFFYASHDGGRSWLADPLPPPAGYPANLFGNCSCGSLPPTFTTRNDGTLMFRSPDLLYVTHDAGATWRPIALPSKYVAQAEFLDAQHGWLSAWAPDPSSHSIRPDRMYVTNDGGQSWQALAHGHNLTGVVHFVTRSVGWMLDPGGNGSPQLYKTADGGNSWTHIETLLIGVPSQNA